MSKLKNMTHSLDHDFNYKLNHIFIHHVRDKLYPTFNDIRNDLDNLTGLQITEIKNDSLYKNTF